MSTYQRQMFEPEPCQAVCNCCHGPHNRFKCERCGGVEFALTGEEGRRVREEGRVKKKPERKKRAKK